MENAKKTTNGVSGDCVIIPIDQAKIATLSLRTVTTT